MTNPWKVATIGLAIAGVTALSTGLTTAWMLRPTAPAQAEAPAAPTVVRPAARYAAAPAPAVARTTPPPTVTRVSSTTVPADCAPGFAMRIARSPPVAQSAGTAVDETRVTVGGGVERATAGAGAAA